MLKEQNNTCFSVVICAKEAGSSQLWGVGRLGKSGQGVKDGGVDNDVQGPGAEEASFLHTQLSLLGK